jgi:opacity protein-like surface antigen
MQRFILLASLMLAMALSALPARAQQTDARDLEGGYFLPNKTLLFNFYGRHEASTVGKDITTNSAIMRATYLLKFGNFGLAPFDVLVPMADATVFTPSSAGSPANVALRGSGMGDLIYVPTIGWGMVQNPKTHSHTWFGLTTFVTMPTGTYDANKLVNIGKNRWLVRPTVTIGQRFAKAITLEAFANVAFASANSEYRLPGQVLQGVAAQNPAAVPLFQGNKELTQNLSYAAGLHAAVDFSASFYLGLSYYYTMNGRQEVTGVTIYTPQKEDEHLHTLRVGLGVRVHETTQILMQYNVDLKAESDSALARGMFVRVSHAILPSPPAPKAAPAPVEEDVSAQAHEEPNQRDESEDEEEL